MNVGLLRLLNSLIPGKPHICLSGKKKEERNTKKKDGNNGSHLTPLHLAKVAISYDLSHIVIFTFRVNAVKLQVNLIIQFLIRLVGSRSRKSYFHSYRDSIFIKSSPESTDRHRGPQASYSNGCRR
jgi:hypothetical protein